MNRLNTDKRVQILRCLIEGNSIRAIARLADVSIKSVIKLLIEAGKVCSHYQDIALQNLPCKRIQCDEIWSFVRCKEKNAMPAKKGFEEIFTLIDEKAK